MKKVGTWIEETTEGNIKKFSLSLSDISVDIVIDIVINVYINI